MLNGQETNATSPKKRFKQKSKTLDRAVKKSAQKPKKIPADTLSPVISNRIIENDSLSDCEIIEQPSTVIVLDDDLEPSNQDRDGISKPTTSNNVDNISNESTNISIISNSSAGIAETESSLLFFEDKRPGSTNYFIPIYEKNQAKNQEFIEILDETQKSTSVLQAIEKTTDIDMQLNRNNFPNGIGSTSTPFNPSIKIRNDSIIPTTSTQLCNAIELLNDTPSTSIDNAISLDNTPRIPKSNLLISVQPTKNNCVATRTCTITSSDTPNAIASDAKTAATCPSKLISRKQVSAIKITFANKPGVHTKRRNDTDPTNEPPSKRSKDVVVIDVDESSRDDSVVFVSETNQPRAFPSRKRKFDQTSSLFSGAPAANYIPLNSGVPQNVAKSRSIRAVRRASKAVTRAMAKQTDKKSNSRSNNDYDGSNRIISNQIKGKSSPSTTATATSLSSSSQGKEKVMHPEKSPLFERRMVIVDGSNVAFMHGAKTKQYSVEGIDLCLQYFESRGFEVKVVVPQMRLKKHMSTDAARLDKLAQLGKIVLTPCKNLPGNRSSSYDDRFILEIAANFDAAIISNDNYSDLLNENPVWDEIIKSRVIGYTWCNNLIMFPNDPYGRRGQTLQQILHKPKASTSFITTATATATATANHTN